MPGIREAYVRSLKMTEAEEIFDLLGYRPVAFGLVQLLRRTPVTPNQITLLALAAGLAAAWNFSSGSAASLAAGACWYLLSNILDCADGQLARLQKSGTPFGRLLDGIADYVSGISIFIGIGAGLAAQGHPDWWLVVVAGMSTACQALLFDYYQGEYMAAVRGESGFLERATAVHAPNGGKINPAVSLYLRYLRLQAMLSFRKHRHRYDMDEYHRKNRGMIRLWSFLGPTTNRTLLIASAFAGHPGWYLIAVSIAGNGYMLVMLLFQWETMRRLHRAAGAAEGE